MVGISGGLVGIFCEPGIPLVRGGSGGFVLGGPPGGSLGTGGAGRLGAPAELLRLCILTSEGAACWASLLLEPTK